MKRLLLVSLLILSAAISAVAQYQVILDKRIENCSGYEAEEIYNTILGAVNQVGYIKIITSDSEGVEEADFRIRPRLEDILSIPIDKDDKFHKYQEKVIVQIAIDRLSDNVTIASESFNETRGSEETRREAITDAIDAIKGKIKNFLLKAIPYYGQVLEISKAKGNEAQELYISLGKRVGIKKGQQLEVKVEKIIGGHLLFKTLGKIKVEELEGEEGARCKVTDGKEDILKAYSETPDKMIVITKENESILGKLKFW